LNERLARILDEKRGPDTVMVSVLVIALALGLIGLAVHVIWVVAVVVMALGLGFSLATSRRNRIDIVNERADSSSAERAVGLPGRRS
jgi:hypothetical protein